MTRRAGWLLLILFTLSCRTSRYQRRGVEDPFEARVPLSELETTDKSRLAAQLDFEARSVEKFEQPRFTIGILELNDAGELHPMQKQQVMQMVDEELGNSKTPLDDGSPGSLLVIFVHGWHHNPRTCDQNLTCFRRVMKELAAFEEKNAAGHHKPRHIVGVYIAWRGREYEGVADYLSVYGRKGAAEHIGRTGGKEVLSELQQKWDAHRKENINPVVMVTVGHSFGGTLVMSAVRGRMTGEISDIAPAGGLAGSYRIVRAQGSRRAATEQKAIRARFGDLVVLANPAIEAAVYETFDRDLRDDVNYQGAAPARLIHDAMPVDKQATYDARQLPIILTLASEGDIPNRYYFPVSRFLAAVNVRENYGAFLEEAEREALGHYQPQITHRLAYSGPSFIDKTDNPGCGCVGADWRALPDILNSPESVDLHAPDQALHFTTSAGEHGEYSLSLTSERKARGWDERSPFLVVSLDKRISNGHNDIFNPIFVGFLYKYVAAIQNAQLEPELTKRKNTVY